MRRIVESTGIGPASHGPSGEGERPSPTTAPPPPQRMGGPLPPLGGGSFGPDVALTTAAAIAPNPLGRQSWHGEGIAPCAAHSRFSRLGGRLSVWRHLYEQAHQEVAVYGRRMYPEPSNRRTSAGPRSRKHEHPIFAIRAVRCAARGSPNGNVQISQLSVDGHWRRVARGGAAPFHRRSPASSASSRSVRDSRLVRNVKLAPILTEHERRDAHRRLWRHLWRTRWLAALVADSVAGGTCGGLGGW